ncbi:MAG: PorP/SprF family type IX secretion system membrane protein [Mangrovimonas sp.]|nr:PorP/SprF family type IX secretion system membrane protein [Mangrovimonas sp.]
MRIHIIVILLFCTAQFIQSQEQDGVVSLALPVRNSLTFNQYVNNPTFSFVRQQHKYISLYNTREWVQFEDAPLTYLASYSGRFRENIGVGLGVFQQNYGVLTTFGGILNFAYNARLNSDNNLTFGINVGTYKSGLNSGKVETNFDDPSLENIPSNFMLSVSPGVNFGTAFFDFGVSVNNLVLYNFNTSEMIKDNPEQTIQAHIMYTGYMESRGFLDESKFTGLVRSEFKKGKTVLSGTAMLTVPIGIWGQVGYNTLYGIHGGIGLNVTKQILIEYNYEKAMGDLTEFGSSHSITLAYKLNNRESFDYSSEDDVAAIIKPTKKKKPAPKSSKTTVQKAEEPTKVAAEEQAKIATEEQARLAAEEKSRIKAEEQARLAAEEKARIASEEQARLDAEEKARIAAEEQARLATEEKARIEAEEQTRLAAEENARIAAEEETRLAAEEKARIEAEEKARLATEEKARIEAEEQARLAAEEKARIEVEEQARLAAEEQAKIDAEKQTVDEESLPEATDAFSSEMNEIVEATDDSKKAQEELLSRLTEAVAVKDQDLKDLKRENDLSEQGIYLEPKPFKSSTEENAAIEAIKSDLDNIIASRNAEITRLERLYEQRQEETDTIYMDEVLLSYKKTLTKLKSEQLAAIKAKADLEAQLETINVATEYEKKRRIKRAVYNNDDDRYAQDRAALESIKQNSSLSNEPLSESDFDFGEERSNNIQILKNVTRAEEGYYLILAVHDDVIKRDDFLKKVVASGQENVDFFFDVNTSKYYIFVDKFDNIQAANAAMETKGSNPYNAKMSIVKIEN